MNYNKAFSFSMNILNETIIVLYNFFGFYSI